MLMQNNSHVSRPVKTGRWRANRPPARTRYTRLSTLPASSRQAIRQHKPPNPSRNGSHSAHPRRRVLSTQGGDSSPPGQPPMLNNSHVPRPVKSVRWRANRPPVRTRCTRLYTLQAYLPANKAMHSSKSLAAMARTLPTRAGGCCSPRGGIHPLQGQPPVHNTRMCHVRLKPDAGGLTVRLRGRDAQGCKPYRRICQPIRQCTVANP